MAITATQRNHVISRLRQVLHQRVSEYEDHLVKEMKDVRGPIPKLTVKVLIEGIRDGSIRLAKGTKLTEEVNGWNDVNDYFDISKWDEEAYNEAIDKKVIAFQEKLKREIRRIEDHLILGDADDAMKLLVDFENYNG